MIFEYTTGPAPIETSMGENGYVSFQRKLPLVRFSETRPVRVAKIICRNPWMVAIIGVVCVTFSFCELQALLPSLVRNAARVLLSYAVFRLTKSRSSSRQGDAALSHPIVEPP